MSFVVFLAKCYIVILLFRFVTTKQELIFNPLGKIIAKATNPVLPKNNERFIPLLIAAIIIITSLLYSISSNAVEFQVKLLSILTNYAHFFMLFYIVSMIFGSFGNRPIGGGFIALFFRLGLPWVKMTRLFIPINSGKIIIPAIIIVYLLTVCLTAVINTIFTPLYPTAPPVFRFGPKIPFHPQVSLEGLVVSSSVTTEYNPGVSLLKQAQNVMHLLVEPGDLEPVNVMWKTITDDLREREVQRSVEEAWDDVAFNAFWESHFQ